MKTLIKVVGWLILICVLGYSLGLIQKYDRMEIGYVIVAVLFLCYLARRRSCKKAEQETIKQVLEALETNTTKFPSANYTFIMSERGKRRIRLQMYFLLKSESSEGVWNRIMEDVGKYMLKHPEIRNSVQFDKILLFDGETYNCFIRFESVKCISPSLLIAISKFLKHTIEEKYLKPVENYVMFFVPIESNHYYVYYLNGVAKESYVKDEEGDIYGMQDMLPDAYRIMYELNFDEDELVINRLSEEEFVKVRDASLLDMD